MDSVMETAATAPAKPATHMLARVLELKTQDSRLVCATADGGEVTLTRLVGSNVRTGDEVAVADSSATTATEIYIRKPSIRGADIYQVKAGYAALPKQDKREESFVRVQVPNGQFGIGSHPHSVHRNSRLLLFRQPERRLGKAADLLLFAAPPQGCDVQGTPSVLSSPPIGNAEGERIPCRSRHARTRLQPVG